LLQTDREFTLSDKELINPGNAISINQVSIISAIFMLRMCP
jgi:hypothetical protein